MKIFTVYAKEALFDIDCFMAPSMGNLIDINIPTQDGHMSILLHVINNTCVWEIQKYFITLMNTYIILHGKCSKRGTDLQSCPGNE